MRNHVVAALGNIKDEPKIASKLLAIARDDASYRARANALQSLGKLKVANALPILTDAVREDSPDDFLRNAALRSLGYLGDDKGVPLLREWSAPGKAIETRTAAIASLGERFKHASHLGCRGSPGANWRQQRFSRYPTYIVNVQCL